MGSPQRYSLFPVDLNGGVSLVNHVGNLRMSPGATKLIATPGGSVYPGAIGTAFSDAVLGLQSMDVPTLLALSSGNFFHLGFNMGSTSTIQYQQRADGAAFQTGSNHHTLTAAKAFIHPTEISARQDDTAGATMDLVLTALYDGTLLPLVSNPAVTLTGTPTVNDVLYLGPAYIEGAEIPGVLSVRIVSGIQFIVARADGEPWPRVGSIVAVNPSIEITVRNLSVLATIGLFGSGTTTGASVYLRRGGHGVSRQADASSVHTKFTITDGEYQLDSLDVDAVDADAEARITIRAKGGAMSVAVTSAIP